MKKEFCNNIRKIGAVTTCLLFLFLWLPDEVFPQSGTRRSIVLFPTVNFTGVEVWESKYYPVSVLEKKMTEYLASLLRSDPFIDVFVLNEGEAAAWLQNENRCGDYAVQMELYSSLAKEREVLGSFENASVALRVRIYSATDGSLSDSRIASGKDQRYTFDPGDDRLYFLNAREYPIFEVIQTNLINKIHEDGLDLLRLTPKDKGQKLSRPTWVQFCTTSHWQAFRNAIAAVHNEVATTPGGFQAIGRLLSPTSDSTKTKRKYIVSLGRKDALQIGDVLPVARSETYITVDPENPVVILPQMIGRVKVLYLQKSEAVVLVVSENKKTPIELMDLVLARKER